MNKTESVYKEKQLIAAFIGCECFEINERVELSDYDDAVMEILSMIAHFIDIGNKKETAEWRRMLQQTKVEKRHARQMIDYINRMEPKSA